MSHRLLGALRALLSFFRALPCRACSSEAKWQNEDEGIKQTITRVCTMRLGMLGKDLGGCGDEENLSNCRTGEPCDGCGLDVECAGSGPHLRLQRMRGSSQPLARTARGVEHGATQSDDSHRSRARAGRTAPARPGTERRGFPCLETQTRTGLRVLPRFRHGKRLLREPFAFAPHSFLRTSSAEGTDGMDNLSTFSVSPGRWYTSLRDARYSP